MAKNIPNALLQWLLAATEYNRADLFTIELQSGQFIYATTAQRPVIFGGNVYQPSLYGTWQRGSIQTEASYTPKANSMSLTVSAPTGLIVAGAGAASTELGSDDFTPSANPVNTSKWTTAIGSPPLKAVSGECQATTVGSDCTSIFTGVSSPDNQYCEETLGANGPSSAIYLLARINSGETDEYLALVTALGPGSQIALFELLGSGNLATWTGTLNAGDKVRLSCLGSLISVSVNGTTVISVFDSTLASGSTGLSIGTNGTDTDTYVTKFSTGSVTNPASIPLMSSITAGLFDAATVTVNTIYWGLGEAPSIGIARGSIITFVGQITKISDLARDKADLEVADMLYQLNLPTPPNLLQSSCRHQLFDFGCTLLRTNFQLLNSAAAGSSNLQINLTNGASTASWWNGVITFTQGYIQFTSGQNVGLVAYIKNLNTNTQILLSNPMPFPVAVGDAFTMYAGCNKSLQMCHVGFNNLINIGSTPFIPNPELGA